MTGSRKKKKTTRTAKAKAKTTSTEPDETGLRAVQTGTAPTGEPAKRGPGRPRGSKTKGKPAAPEPVPAEQPRPLKDSLPEEYVRAIVWFPYWCAAQRMGDHWLLSEMEIEAMFQTHWDLAEEYLPQVIKEHPVLYTVFMQHAMALALRFTLELRERAKRRREENQPFTPSPVAGSRGPHHTPAPAAGDPNAGLPRA